MAEVRFDRGGPSGNVFWILGAAQTVIPVKKAEEMRQRVFSCTSYESALAVIGEYVKLVEVGVK